MRAGKLRNIIAIQRRIDSKDDYGGPVYTWEDLANVWADIIPLSGRELIAAQAAKSEITTRFVIRYRDDVTPTMRIVFGGANYNIMAPPIDTNMNHKELVIMASTGLNAG